MGGIPVIAGTRVPFQTLLDSLDGGHSLDVVLDDFPTVSREIAVARLATDLSTCIPWCPSFWPRWPLSFPGVCLQYAAHSLAGELVDPTAPAASHRPRRRQGAPLRVAPSRGPRGAFGP